MEATDCQFLMVEMAVVCRRKMLGRLLCMCKKE